MWSEVSLGISMIRYIYSISVEIEIKCEVLKLNKQIIDKISKLAAIKLFSFDVWGNIFLLYL